MSPFFDYVSLFAGTAFCLFFRFLDWRITTTEFPKWGVKEDNPWVRTNTGALNKPKALILILGIVAVAWIAFFAFEETEYWDRFWCGVIAAVGGVASGIAYFSNKRLIRKIKERGGIPSAGVGVPGGTIV